MLALLRPIVRGAASGMEYGMLLGLVVVISVLAISNLGPRIAGIYQVPAELLAETHGTEPAEAWSFPLVLGAEILAQAEATPRVLHYLGGAAAIAVGGQGAEYRIDGNPWTAAPGTVDPGATVAVRILTGPEFLTTHTAVLTIGAGAHPFSVTTRAPVTLPSPFEDFAPVSDAEPSSTVGSEPRAIAGTEAPTTIHIAGEGAAYRIDGGPWTSAPGTIGPDQTVEVRLETTPAFDTFHTAVLSVVGAEAWFSVTTRAAITAPSGMAEFDPAADVDPETTVVSNTITVLGTEAAATLAVSALHGALRTSAMITASPCASVRTPSRIPTPDRHEALVERGPHRAGGAEGLATGSGTERRAPERTGEAVRQARRRADLQPENVSALVDAGPMSRGFSPGSRLSHVAHLVAQLGGTPARNRTGFPVKSG